MVNGSDYGGDGDGGGVGDDDDDCGYDNALLVLVIFYCWF